MNSIATPSNRDLTVYASSILFLLVIFDTVFTHLGLQGGHITEANPLMRYLYDFHVGLFFLIKLILPILLIWLVTRLEPKPYIQLMIAGAIFIYTFVLLKHVYWIYFVYIG